MTIGLSCFKKRIEFWRQVDFVLGEKNKEMFEEETHKKE
jgi:hypothetical protein